MSEDLPPERLWKDLCVFHVNETRVLTDRLLALLNENDAMRNRLTEAEAKGRAAERAEIVQMVQARAEVRHSQAKATAGDWRAIVAKANEIEAIADAIKARAHPLLETTP